MLWASKINSDERSGARRNNRTYDAAQRVLASARGTLVGCPESQLRNAVQYKPSERTPASCCKLSGRGCVVAPAAGAAEWALCHGRCTQLELLQALLLCKGQEEKPHSRAVPAGLAAAPAVATAAACLPSPAAPALQPASTRNHHQALIPSGSAVLELQRVRT